MPLPRAVARFNKRVTNRITSLFATRLPGFGIVTHTGRKSGREYRTSINIFRRGGRYIVALTYGPDADWVRNVLAAGGCTLETHKGTVRLTNPRLFHDEQRRAMPTPVRQFLGLARVFDFLALGSEV